MNLLLEIGAEEIPDWMLAGALDYLSNSLSTLLADRKLGGANLRTDATPRRLVLRAESILANEPDAAERVWGPAKSAPEAAVAGFAKKQGLTPADLEIQSDGKAEKYTFIRKTEGRPANDILSETLPSLILKTPFPKTMYWPGKGGPRFIRPIRWIVALLGDEVIPFEIADVWSGNESAGHRKLGAARFAVTYDTYEQRLRENYVILSAEERRNRIKAVPTKYKCDNELLKMLVNLTEWPTPITGSFDPQFLDLPKEVLITAMRVHQKYFSVETPDGKLAAQFVAVTNTDGDPEGLIRHGNEQVLRARFNDARFFWNADQKKHLTERVKDLANVTYHAKLGTYLEKTERITGLTLILLTYLSKGGEATAADINEAKARYAFSGNDPEFYPVRAARLCKADLTTELVKEFTELQGVVGGLYAKAQGEPSEVADAIYGHYRPASMEDAVPSTVAGQIVSIADKLDTLRGCFKIGLIPTGSKDPFALRRAAQGIVRIVVEGKLRLPLRHLLENDSQLEDFFLDRLRYYFRDVRGFGYDEVNAVIAAGWDDLVDVEERLRAVHDARAGEDFEAVAASFKRIKNILRQANFSSRGHVEESLLTPGPETELWQACASADIDRPELDYAGRIAAIVTLRPALDLFFDKVLVNAPEPAVRHNRQTMLHAMLAEYSTIADFSEIVTTSSTTSQENK